MLVIERRQRSRRNGNGRQNNPVVSSGLDQDGAKTCCKISAGAIGTQQWVDGCEAFAGGRVEIIDGFPCGISARSVISRIAFTMADGDNRFAGRWTGTTV